MQTSGRSCRENADVYLLFDIRIEILSRHCERSDNSLCAERSFAQQASRRTDWHCDTPERAAISIETPREARLAP